MAKNLPQKVIMTGCPGEAHSNAYIDNCTVCAPYGWGVVPLDDSEVRTTKPDPKGRKVKWTRGHLTRELLEQALEVHFQLNASQARALVRDMEAFILLVDNDNKDSWNLLTRGREAHTLSCRCGRCL